MTSRQRVDGGARPPTRVVIGLTGPIAAGKSTVASMLETEGAEVIDADRIYHTLICPQSPLWNAIVEHFGASILGHDREINRSALASIVFADPQQLAALERLTHASIVAEIRHRIARSTSPIVVVEAVKLVQSGLGNVIDALWLITADDETRVYRLQQRGGVTRAGAMDRIAASENALPKNVRPDVTIDTSAGMDATRLAVMNALRATVASAA